MKIERIACNKLKVTVTPEDLLLHGLSFESFSADSPQVQDFFWNLIQKAGSEADFVIDEGRVIIEAMPMKNNGLVVILTKPDGNMPIEHTRFRRVRYRVKTPRLPQTQGPVQIYRFETFDDLCAFVRAWPYGELRSSLYALGEDYILTITPDESICPERTARARLMEFGRPANDLSEAYLGEYAKTICDGNTFSAIRRHFKD
ncbi:MAG: adaptor protein MecA [Clostridia bacterium]|nr:adaptor protein MecA [Clostridia bacterium]